jgi:hypothetical protein
MSCDILESERGPSIENLDEIKNLNGTIFVRFVNETLTVTDSDNDELPDYLHTRVKKPRLLKQKAKALVNSSPTKPVSTPENDNTTGSQNSVAASLSVTAMLRLRRLIRPRKETVIQIQGFDVNNEWSPSRNVSFYVEDEQYDEGGFRNVFKCMSSDEHFPGTWLLKKYNDRAKNDLDTFGMSEEVHARKQTQMHNLAKNIADQMAKKVSSEFGEVFSYNKVFFGIVQGINTEVVTIEELIEGHPFIKYMNNTGEIMHDRTMPAVQKAEALAHFSYQVSQKNIL